MKTLKVLAIGLVIIGIAAYIGSNGSISLKGVPKAPSYNSVTTSQVSATAGTSTIVLTQKGGRGYVSICNDTTNAKGYIQLGTTATTSTAVGSRILASGSCYEITEDNLYTGEIRYTPEATTTTLQVVEFIGY